MDSATDSDATLAPSCKFELRDSPLSEEEGQLRLYRLSGFTRRLSESLDLGRLEAVVVGHDYDAALASIDSPIAGDRIPTNNEYGAGRAMHTTVERDGEIWSIVVIWAPLVEALFGEDADEALRSMHTLAHEFAHVSDIKWFADTFPGGWKAAKPRDRRDSFMQNMVNDCQSEYRAQFQSATWSPGQGLELRDMFAKALDDLPDQLFTARFDLDGSQDWDAFWNAVSTRVTFVFYAVGYFLGHADAILEDDDQPEDLKKQYEEAVESIEDMSLGWLVQACREAIRPFTESVAWSGMDMYDGLIDVAERLLNEHKIFTSVGDEGQLLYQVEAMPTW